MYIPNSTQFAPGFGLRTKDFDTKVFLKKARLPTKHQE